MPRDADADVEAEAWVLGSSEGQALLASVTEIREPTPALIDRWRRQAAPTYVAAAMRLARGRLRGVSKFRRSDRMWFEATGLEQATAELVAQHKAQRFEPGGLVVDLCAGIGGDTISLALERRVVAVDRDHGMCRRVRWNANVYDVGDRVDSVQARAELFPVPPQARVHIDPDRRAHAGPRARAIPQYVPGLSFLRSLAERVRGGAIKLSPASDFDVHFVAPSFELELVSLGGECKEATVWFGDLAGCHRRATSLPSGATWTDADGPIAQRVPQRSLGRWIYDPDPALLRAGLLDSFALVHGLARCQAGVDYLTADVPIGSPLMSRFEVADVFPVDLKTLRRELARRSVGTLEIKSRGLSMGVDRLREQLRLDGPNSATLILVGGSGPSRAVLARRPAASA